MQLPPNKFSFIIKREGGEKHNLLNLQKKIETFCLVPGSLLCTCVNNKNTNVNNKILKCVSKELQLIIYCDGHMFRHNTLYVNCI